MVGCEYNFVSDVPDYLKCIVCHLVVSEPVLLVECGHRFCKSCFNDVKEHAERIDAELLCPTCRVQVQLEKVFDDKNIGRAVLDLNVKCSHYLDGCVWTGEVRNLQAHLDHVCRITEKERTLALLQRLQTRIENCEKGLVEKDHEIAALRGELKQSQCTFNDKISRLEHYIEKNANQIVDKSSLEMALQPNEQLSDISNHVGVLQRFDDITNQLCLLQQHVRNVHLLRKNGEAMFMWKLENYKAHREKCEEVYSPMFYSGLNSHCFRIGVDWSSRENEEIALWLHFCRGLSGEVSSEPFTLGIVVEVVNVADNISKARTLKTASIEEHRKVNKIKYGEKSSLGFGFKHFLATPSLENFIVDDSLLIKCTLIAS